MQRCGYQNAIEACALAGRATGDETLGVNELTSRHNGPGRLLGMTAEMIDTAAKEAARIYANQGVTFTLLGAEQRLRIPEKPPHDWLARNYDRLEVAK